MSLTKQKHEQAQESGARGEFADEGGRGVGELIGAPGSPRQRGGLGKGHVSGLSLQSDDGFGASTRFHDHRVVSLYPTRILSISVATGDSYFAFDAFDILPRLLKCASLPSSNTLVAVYLVLEDWMC